LDAPLPRNIWPHAKTNGPCTNFFALGILLLALQPLVWSPRSSDLRESSRTSRCSWSKQTRVEGRVFLLRRPRQLSDQFMISRAQLTPGFVSSLSGNHALAARFVTAAQKAGLRRCFRDYPITPAWNILHELSQYRTIGVTDVSTEDKSRRITFVDWRGVRRRALRFPRTFSPVMALKRKRWASSLAVEFRPWSLCDTPARGPYTGCRPRPSQAPTCCRLYLAELSVTHSVLAGVPDSADLFPSGWRSKRAASPSVMCAVNHSFRGYPCHGADWRIPE